MIYILTAHILIGLLKVTWEVGMATENLMCYVATKQGTTIVVKFNRDAHGEKYIYVDDQKAFLYCENKNIAELYTGTYQNYVPLELKKKNGMNYVPVNIFVFELFIYQNELFQHYQNFKNEKINGATFGRGDYYYKYNIDISNYCNL